MDEIDFLAAFDAGFEAFFDPLGSHGGFGFGIGFKVWICGLFFAGEICEELELLA